MRPELLQIEPNTRCNLACPICPATAGEAHRPRGQLDLETYRRFVGEAFEPPYVVIFSGFSEALLSPALPALARYEKDRGCRVFVASNGVLLDAAHRDPLLDAGIDQLIVSLDSHRAEVFEAIRRGARFDALLDGLRGLRDAIAARGLDSRIVINAVVMRSTAPGLGDLMDFLAAEGISDLALIKIMKIAAMRHPMLEAEYLDWPAYRELDWPALETRAAGLGLRCMRSDPDALAERGCHLPARSFYISAGLDVTACPMLAFFPDWNFGNLRREGLDRIQASPAARRLRRLHREGGALAVCRACACLFS